MRRLLDVTTDWLAARPEEACRRAALAMRVERG